MVNYTQALYSSDPFILLSSQVGGGGRETISTSSEIRGARAGWENLGEVKKSSVFQFRLEETGPAVVVVTRTRMLSSCIYFVNPCSLLDWNTFLFCYETNFSFSFKKLQLEMWDS